MSDFVKFYELNESYIENLIRCIKEDIWVRQEEITYSDRSKSKYPILTEGAYDVIAKAFDENIYNLRYAVVMSIMDWLYRDIIDPGENRKELEEYFGWEYPDWENDLPKEVFFEHNHERMTRPAFLPY